MAGGKEEMAIMGSGKRQDMYKVAFSGCNFAFKENKKLVEPVIRSFALEEIITQYEDSEYSTLNSLQFYSYNLLKLRKIKYTVKDIQDFCSELNEDAFGSKAGIYISALVNNIIKQDEIIIIKPNTPISSIGYMHYQGILVIDGDAGFRTGREMANGEIRVTGSAVSSTGLGMSGGKITIEGDVDNYTGWGMLGGRIIIKGNSGYDTGQEMLGGKIYVAGEIYGLSDNIANGEIWEAGKKVYPK